MQYEGTFMPGNFNPVLGIDIGGVLIDRANDDADTSFFGPNYLLTTAVTDAFTSIRRLSNSGYNIYLVSKCGKKTEEKTRHWLAHHQFFEKAAVLRSNIRFCRKRNEKAQICAEIGAGYFIDDRLEVLSYLTSVPNLYLFNADEREVQQFSEALTRVTRVSSWNEVALLLLDDLGTERSSKS